MMCVVLGRRRWSALFGVCLLTVWLLLHLGSAHGRGSPTSYAFLHHSVSGAPVAYPCGTLHYEISMPDAPADFAQVVEGAVGRLEAASGYQFAYDGPAPDRNFYAHLVDGWGGPIMIGFSDEKEIPGLVGDVIGRGGSALSSDGSHLTTGLVVLDRSYYDHETDLKMRQAVVLHELGHVLGLAHVHDTTQVMDPTIHAQTTEFGRGDLAGLRALHQASCGAAVPSPAP